MIDFVRVLSTVSDTIDQVTVNVWSVLEHLHAFSTACLIFRRLDQRIELTHLIFLHGHWKNNAAEK
jgi:hypothetical protein